MRLVRTNYPICLAAGILLLAAQSHAQDITPGITITAAQSTIAPCEPLTLRIDYRLPESGVDNTQFSIEINGKKIAEDHTLFPRSFAKGRVRDSNILTFMIEPFCNPVDKQPFFAEAGDYTVVVSDEKAQVRSNSLTVRVRTATPAEQEALQLFTGNTDRLVTLLTSHERGKATQDFENLCQKHPDTVYAAHASCALGMKKFTQITKDVNKRRDVAEYKKIMPYFQRAIGKSPGSALQERAVFHLAWCQALTKQYQACRKNLESLQTDFAHGEYALKVRSMLKELDDHGH